MSNTDKRFTTERKMCGSRKYPYLLHGRFSRLNSPSPLEFPIKLHTFPYKFWLLIPAPLRISNDLPWGGYGYLLEPHNDTRFVRSIVDE